MPKPTSLEVGTVIRRMRQAAHMDQKTLASALGLTPSVLSRVENGTQKMPLAALLFVAKVCGFQIQARRSDGQALSLKAPAQYHARRIRKPKVKRAVA